MTNFKVLDVRDPVDQLTDIVDKYDKVAHSNKGDGEKREEQKKLANKAYGFVIAKLE